ncbi:MAG TPA: hypothetical protein VEC15_01045, partial [Actinomycetota bacterium]|nr:hypothetical protein [Actinomycetota bacterium]
MPERWEHELRKLRSVERPSSLQDRLADGPRHEPGRPTRERVTAAVVAFAVCAAVGVAGFQTLREDDGSRGGRIGDGGTVSPHAAVVIELSSNTDGPTATVRYGDREQRAVFEGATWCPDGMSPPAPSDGTASPDSQCSSYIADFAYYPPVSEFLVVPPGTPIEVVGPATITEILVTDPNGEPFPAASGIPAALPGDDGMLVYDVHAEWPQGTGDFFFGIQTLGDPANAPDVLTVDCTSFVARLDTAVVRTQPDGLHLRIVGDTIGFAIGTPGPDGTGEPTSAIGGTDQGSVALPPGQWGIKCGKGSAIGSLLAPFELIDPDDHYAPWELTCAAGSGSTFSSSVPTSTPHAEAIEQVVTGLAEGDRIRGAGYGAETWRLGPEYVVDRRGEAVARIVLGEEGGVWTGTVETCDGSGIELTATTDGASSPSPVAADILTVRCEGLGPALELAQVRLQDDGLHVEATNVADASFVTIEHDDGTVVPEMIVFKHVTMQMTVDIEP